VSDQPVEETPRIERVIQESLQRVDTPEAARKVVERVERLAGNRTEAELAQKAAATPAPAPQVVEQAGACSTPDRGVADVLATTAAEAVAPTPEAPQVVEAAQRALRPDAAVSPGASRGRQLLKAAVLRRMGPAQALDARVYIAINEAPHPGWLDSLAYALAIITIGGWIWVVGTLVAYLFRVPRGWLAVMRLLPCVVGATWIVEYPIKGYFRRHHAGAGDRQAPWLVVLPERTHRLIVCQRVGAQHGLAAAVPALLCTGGAGGLQPRVRRRALPGRRRLGGAVRHHPVGDDPASGPPLRLELDRVALLLGQRA
jgi:hypothetical protein